MTGWHRKLFYLLVLLLPTQLGYFFFPDWSLVRGLRVDFLSPVVYLTDIIIFLMLGTWLLEKRRLPVRAATVFLIGFACVNTLAAVVWQVALVKWLTVGEMILVGLYVKYEWGAVKTGFYQVLSLALGYTAFLAATQFVMGRTIGGPLYFLGERSFSATTPGIALFSVWGREVLRPYATFPHPNSLGGFGLVAFFVVITSRVTWSKYFSVVSSFFLVAISFSQNAWAVFVVVLGIFLLANKVRGAKRVVPWLIGGAVVLSLALPAFSQGLAGLVGTQESVSKRLVLAEYAGKFFSQSPLWGVGLGNFIAKLPSVALWWLHPVHNIFLLVLVEVGIMGFLIAVWFLAKTSVKALGRRDLGIALALLAIIVSGMVDHYWLTLHQNLLLFAIVMGIAHAKEA